MILNENVERNLLVAIDFSECSNYAINWILSHMRLTSKDRITLITIPETPKESTRIHNSFDEVAVEQASFDQLQKMWKVYKDKYKIPSEFQIDLKVEFGKPADKLVELTKTGKFTVVCF
jgi:hypothetical protein